MIDANQIVDLFKGSNGYQFARWGRPIVPMVVGTDDVTLTHLKEAITQTVGITGGIIAETDLELGANFMMFFCQNWEEILGIPDLDKLIVNLPEIITGLSASNALQYRYFAFDEAGAIKLCVTMIRIAGEYTKMPVQTLGVTQSFLSLLTWREDAFAKNSPIARIKENNITIVKPEYAAVVRAAYDPILPVAANDESHAFRLAARAQLLLKDLEE